MNRLTYLAIIIGIILLGLGLGYYLHSQNSPATTAETPATPITSGTLPPISSTSTPKVSSTETVETPTLQGNQAFGVISASQAIAYFVDSENTVTLITPDGTVLRITSGSPTTISNTPTPNLFAASFSFDGKYILALSGNAASPSANLFDTTMRTWHALSVHPISPSWSPVKDRFAYLAPRTSGETIETLDASNAKSAPALTASIEAVDVGLSWTDASHMLLAGKPSAFAAGSAWLYDMQKKTFATIVSDQNGLMVNWNGATDSGIYFGSGNNRAGVLSFVDETKSNSNVFSFLTLPSKCAFANPTATGTSTTPTPILYCAIPRIADKDFYSATLPDDYLQNAVLSVDDISAINLATGDIHPIWNNQGQAIDATNLQIKNGMVFFLNRYDGKLYAATVGK